MNNPEEKKMSNPEVRPEILELEDLLQSVVQATQDWVESVPGSSIRLDKAESRVKALFEDLLTRVEEQSLNEWRFALVSKRPQIYT